MTDLPGFRDPYLPLLRLSAVVPSPDARGALPGETAHDVADRAADALADWLARHHETTAALVVEPLVQCAAGMAMHSAHYLQRVRALCDQHEVHLVLDEIAVGFGRTGTLFAHEQAAIRPDFLCLSKGLTGGTLALSVVLTTPAVHEAFLDDGTARAFLHSHTYAGNPLACRAALATLDLFERTDALRSNRTLATVLETAFADLSMHPRVRHARRCGTIFAWDVPGDEPDFARRYTRAAHAQGLVMRPIGRTLYVMPPYVLTQDDAAFLAHGAHAALAEVLGP